MPQDDLKDMKDAVEIGREHAPPVVLARSTNACRPPPPRPALATLNRSNVMVERASRSPISPAIRRLS
jgi:hypothetical protein